MLDFRKGSSEGPSPLDLASRHGHLDVMRALLDASADVNFRDSNRRISSVHAAVDGDQCAAISVLVEAGCGIHALNGDCFQPIHVACARDKVQVLGTLLRHEADIGAVDFENRRPINVAAEHGSNAVVGALLAAGSYVDRNPDKRIVSNPLQGAAKHGHAYVVTTLLNNGADVNFEDNEG